MADAFDPVVGHGAQVSCATDEFDSDAFGDLPAPPQRHTADHEITQRAPRFGRHLDDQPLDPAGLAPHDADTFGWRYPVRELPPRQVDIIHVKTDRVDERYHRFQSRECIDGGPNRGIAVPVGAAIARTTDEFV